MYIVRIYLPDLILFKMNVEIGKLRQRDIFCPLYLFIVPLVLKKQGFCICIIQKHLKLVLLGKIADILISYSTKLAKILPQDKAFNIFFSCLTKVCPFPLCILLRSCGIWKCPFALKYRLSSGHLRDCTESSPSIISRISFFVLSAEVMVPFTFSNPLWKKNFSSKTPRGVCTYLPLMARDTVDS